MHGQGAKTARTAAASVRHNRKPGRLETRNTALIFIRGMRRPQVGKTIDRVELVFGERLGERKLHHEAVTMSLQQGFPPERVLVLCDEHESSIEGILVIPDLFIGRNLQGCRRGLRSPLDNDGARYAREIGSPIEPACDLQDLGLSHSVDQNVGLCIKEERPSYPVIPPIVVREPPKARLDTAEDDGDMAKRLPHAISVNDRRPVRTQSGPSPRRIGVSKTEFLVGRVIGDHGVEVAGGYPEKKPGGAETQEIPCASPVRLSDNTDSQACRLEHPSYDRGSV